MFIRYKLICFLWSNRLLRTKTDGKGTEKKLYMQVIGWKKCNFSSNYIKLLRADLYLTTTSTRFRDQSTSYRAQRDSSYSPDGLEKSKLILLRLYPPVSMCSAINCHRSAFWEHPKRNRWILSKWDSASQIIRHQFRLISFKPNKIVRTEEARTICIL